MQDWINAGGSDLGVVIKIFVGACRGVEAFHRLAEPYAVRDIKVPRTRGSQSPLVAAATRARRLTRGQWSGAIGRSGRCTR